MMNMIEVGFFTDPVKISMISVDFFTIVPVRNGGQ